MFAEAQKHTVVARVRTAPPTIDARTAEKKRILSLMRQDYFLYLKVAYHFATNVYPSRLDFLRKKGVRRLSKICAPVVEPHGLGVQRLASRNAPSAHFILQIVRAVNVPGTGKGFQKFNRLARMALMNKKFKFFGNDQLVQALPTRFEGRAWKFAEEEYVVQYDPNIAKLKIYVEFNFEHQITPNDKASLGLKARASSVQVTEATVAWCTIPVSVCAGVREETVIPIRLCTGTMEDPKRIDDLRQEEENAKGGLMRSLNFPCLPKRQSLLMVRIKPMHYHKDDFQYLPPNFITTIEMATVMTLYQMMIGSHLEACAYTQAAVEPVLKIFPRILDDDMMLHHFIGLWKQESAKCEQVSANTPAPPPHTHTHAHAHAHACVLSASPAFHSFSSMSVLRLTLPNPSNPRLLTALRPRTSSFDASGTA